MTAYYCAEFNAGGSLVNILTYLYLFNGHPVAVLRFLTHLLNVTSKMFTGEQDHTVSHLECSLDIYYNLSININQNLLKLQIKT